MNREEIIMLVSDKLRLIRTEAGYTQDKMAEIIGVSKKTLVQIEKGRVLAKLVYGRIHMCTFSRNRNSPIFIWK